MGPLSSRLGMTTLDPSKSIEPLAKPRRQLPLREAACIATKAVIAPFQGCCSRPSSTRAKPVRIGYPSFATITVAVRQLNSSVCKRIQSYAACEVWPEKMHCPRTVRVRRPTPITFD